MALVEAPGALDGDPVAIHHVEGDVGGLDGATEQRGVQHVGEESFLLEELATALGFAEALLVEVDVHPAGEQVLGVPLALAVAEQDQLVGHGPSLAS